MHVIHTCSLLWLTTATVLLIRNEMTTGIRNKMTAAVTILIRMNNYSEFIAL